MPDSPASRRQHNPDIIYETEHLGIRLGSNYGIIRRRMAVMSPPHSQKDLGMSLRPQPIGPIPEQTARVAHAAFPKGIPI